MPTRLLDGVVRYVVWVRRAGSVLRGSMEEAVLLGKKNGVAEGCGRKRKWVGAGVVVVAAPVQGGLGIGSQGHRILGRDVSTSFQSWAGGRRRLTQGWRRIMACAIASPTSSVSNPQ